MEIKWISRTPFLPFDCKARFIVLRVRCSRTN